MATHKSVVLAVLVSGVAVGLGAVSSLSHAGAPYSGRHVDHQSQSEQTAGAKVSGKSYLPSSVYVGRRSDHSQTILASQPVEQAELAAFEEGRPIATKRAAYPHAGRRMDSLH